MARIFNRRTNRWEDDGVPPPPPGSTVAKDATVASGLQSGGLTSTAGQALANAPKAAFSFNRPAPAVIAGTPGDNAAALQQASTFLDTGKVGKLGQADVPVDQQAKLAPGSVTTTSSGGKVTVGASPGAQPGTSGIFVDGQAVTHDANGQLVAAPVGKAPLSYAEQQAEAVRMYPDIGVAGSDANKKFLAAFQKAGGDQTKVLDVANGLFGPKTQAQAIAQSKAQTQREASKAATDAFNNRTPEQIATDNAKAAGNQAKVTAAGNEVYDPDNTGANVASTIKNAAAGVTPSSVADYYSDPSTFGGSIVSGVKNFFGGFGSDPTSTAAQPTYPATQNQAIAQDKTNFPPASAGSALPTIQQLGLDYDPTAGAPSTNPAPPTATAAAPVGASTSTDPQGRAIARNANPGAPDVNFQRVAPVGLMQPTAPATTPPRNPLDPPASAVAGALTGALTLAPTLPVPTVPNPLDPDEIRRRLTASAPAAGY